MSKKTKQRRVIRFGIAAAVAVTTAVGLGPWESGASAVDRAVPAAAAPAAALKPVDRLARVVRVVDGDTIDVRYPGERKGVSHRIRVVGLNTMELRDNHYPYGSTECGAVSAANLLRRMVGGKVVRLTARDAASTTDGPRHRLRRTIEVKQNGRWVDPSLLLLQQGLALWLPNGVEYRPNARYSAAVQEAAAARRGLWRANPCGTSPSPGARLHVSVDWKGTEKVTITNSGAKAVPIGRWWLRDSGMRGNSMAHGYEFPAGTVVPARKSIVLHIDSAKANGGRHYHWRTKKLFDNVRMTPAYVADGAYLFDPTGAIRAAEQYAPWAYVSFSG